MLFMILGKPTNLLYEEPEAVEEGVGQIFLLFWDTKLGS
jgi:hypothetical protein